jgi:hypothetical protein
MNNPVYFRHTGNHTILCTMAHTGNLLLNLGSISWVAKVGEVYVAFDKFHLQWSGTDLTAY